MKYRKDIDGLRAIAVLVVIFCHLGMDTFSGGFLGVDIFFVISGFLITSNIIRKLEANTFSFKGFYLNRIKRIAPVLVVILSLLTLFNYVVLLPQPLDNYLDFLPYAALGLGNIAAANLNYGYFDAVAERYQLLHTWSLGVEEQFYLLAPVILFVLWKVKNLVQRNILVWAIYVLTVLLSIYFVQFTNLDKDNYYLLHTRFFEIFTGSVLAINYNRLPRISSKWLGNLGYLLALGGILCLSYIFNGKSSWPGLNALWVSLLSAGIIYLGKEDNTVTWIGGILNKQGLRFIGKISYSLYLWHWIVIATLVELGHDVNHFPFLEKMGLLVCVMIPLSYLSWKYVENVFRYKWVFTFNKALAVWVLAPFFFFIGLAYLKDIQPSYFFSDQDLDRTSYAFANEYTSHQRITNNPLTMDLRKKYKGLEYYLGGYNEKKEHLGRPLKTFDAEVLLLTNSHIHAFKYFLDSQLKEGKMVAHVMHESNPKIYGDNNSPKIYRELLRNKKYLVLWARPKMSKMGKTGEDWHFWIVSEAIKLGVQPIIYVPGLEMQHELQARGYLYGEKLFNKRKNQAGNRFGLFENITYLAYVQEMYDRFGTKAKWVDFKPLMCDRATCQLWKDDAFALFDKHHISREIGQALGTEYTYRYGNIFADSWEQSPIMLQKDLFTPNSIKSGRVSASNERGYRLGIDLQKAEMFIEKTFDRKIDSGTMFFFHVFPQDSLSLPEARRKHGFNNLDVLGKDRYSFLEGTSIYFGRNKLPNYPIKSIRIGHFKPGGKKYFEKQIDLEASPMNANPSHEQ
jgi:peptidoglycan/LPS O-acetylase OafA/YrhL